MLDVCQDTVIDLERSQGHLAILSRALLVLGAGAYLAPRGQSKAFFTHAGNSSGQNLWATPVWLIDRLMEVFGRFDLDPCAATRSPTTRAKTVFLPEDDGLQLSWFGRVFINPPYSRELPLWIHKIVVEVQARHIALAIALIPVRTDTKWWHEAIASGATPVFLKGRLKFGNSEQSAPFPSALLLWNASVDELMHFRKVFPDALM